MEGCESDFLKLIECVEQKKSLYDKKDHFYYNKIVREKTWDEVGQACGKTGSDCKHRWKLLRERFCKEMKKLECPSDNVCSTQDEWKFLPAMMWLKDSLHPRRPKYNEPWPTSFVSMNSVESEESILEPIASPTSKSPVPVKKMKYTLDSLVQKFGETIENMERNMLEIEPQPVVETTATDEAVANAIVCLMKELPLPIKDKFQADMFQELYRLREEYRKYK